MKKLVTFTVGMMLIVPLSGCGSSGSGDSPAEEMQEDMQLDPVLPGDTNAAPEALAALANDEDPGVRQAVGRNPSTPAGTLAAGTLRRPG